MTSATPALASASTAEPGRTDAAVRLEHLMKRYPERAGWRDTLRHPFRREYKTVLHDISCEVRHGEFFGLLGPNGAGKTTLFKILATLVLPDGGRALVHGHDVVRAGARVRRLLTPVIADERSLQWRLSAPENLELFAALYELDAREARERIGALLELVGLDTTGAQMVGRFSSGMKQKLLIARALLARPRVLLLDEPTRSLDPISARTLRHFLREEIAGRQGCTVLLATHNAEEAFELCDRLAVLDRGRLVAVGSASELSRSVGEERYTLWTRDPEHPVFRALVDSALATRCEIGARGEEGWQEVQLDVPGGMNATAAVIDALAAAHVPVARLERTPLSLAELIDRVVHRHRRSIDA